ATEAHIPFISRWRSGDPIAALRAHALTSTDPKFPDVSWSARAYSLLSALMRAVARHPASTSWTFASASSSAASDSAATSSRRDVYMIPAPMLIMKVPIAALPMVACARHGFGRVLLSLSDSGVQVHVVPTVVVYCGTALGAFE